MRSSILVPMLAVTLLSGLAAQEDTRFSMVQIDGGAAESAAVADFNNDGRLDIVSAGSWYEEFAPSRSPAATSIPSATCRSTWTATASPT